LSVEVDTYSDKEKSGVSDNVNGASALQKSEYGMSADAGMRGNYEAIQIFGRHKNLSAYTQLRQCEVRANALNRARCANTLQTS